MCSKIREIQKNVPDKSCKGLKGPTEDDRHFDLEPHFQGEGQR